LAALLQAARGLCREPGARGFDAAVGGHGGGAFEAQVAGDDQAAADLAVERDAGQGHGDQHDQGEQQHDTALARGYSPRIVDVGFQFVIPHTTLRSGITVS
jgi:hypothetical protein